MIEKLLDFGDGKFLIPLVVVVAGATMVKGAFSLARSRSQDRRDFLDLFRGHDAQSDLWISVAVRHVFGAYLPSSLIRQLMSAPQPGRALFEVANAWNFLEMNDETGELAWRRKWLRFPRVRKWVVRIMFCLYVGSGSASLYLAYLNLTGKLSDPNVWLAWLYAGIFAVGAFAALSYGDTLKDADKAARRWLGLT